MKKYFLLILTIGLLGCSKETKIPDHILPKEKMVSILIDIHLLEERIDYINMNKDSAKKVYRAYEYEIFKEHGVDTAHYQESFKYYSWEVRHMTSIYEAVVDSLNNRQKSLGRKKVDNEGEPPIKSSKPELKLKETDE